MSASLSVSFIPSTQEMKVKVKIRMWNKREQKKNNAKQKRGEKEYETKGRRIKDETIKYGWHNRRLVQTEKKELSQLYFFCFSVYGFSLTFNITY